MKIPVGDFGFATPGAAPRVDVPAASPTGLRELGNTAQRLAAENLHGETSDAILIAKEARRAEAMTIHARAQNALGDEQDRIRQGIQDGTIKTDDAPKLWADGSRKIADGFVKQVDSSNAELVRAGLEGSLGHFGRQINEAVVVRNRHDIGARLADHTEEMHRLWLKDPVAARTQGVMAIDSQGPLAGYNPEQVQKLRQNFIEIGTFNAANQYLVTHKDDKAALDGFVKRLGDLPDLDPGKRNALTLSANSAIARLEGKALAAENRRLVQLQRMGLQLETRIAMGIPINPVDFDRYMTAAKGTDFEASAQGLLEEQRVVTDVLKKSPAQQAAYVGQLEQKLVTTGEGNPRIVARLKQTVTNTIKLLNDNPMQYAMDRGGALIEPLEIGKPDTWQDNLAHRSEVVAAQAKQIGGGRGVLFPQEAAELGRFMQDGTPMQKTAMLQAIRRGIGDDSTFRSTVQQFAKDSPVTGIAASIATREAPLVAGRLWWKQEYAPGSVAATLLTGEHLLNPTRSDKAQDGKGKAFPMPSGADEKAMDQRFADTVGEVFAGAPDAYRAQLQAARAFYAGTLSQKGDYSGSLDSRAWARAIEATLPVARFNGSPVAVPWGMDEGTFKNRVADAFPMAVKSAGLPAEVAQATGRFTLQNLTGTRYLVRQGTEYLTGPKGKVVIDVPDMASTYQSPSERARRAVPE